MLNRIRIALCGIAVVALLSTSALWAQAIFATLTGVVTDPSGAVVANAKITLRDAGSGSERNSVTDSQGFYTFASIPVGTYNLTIEAPGFQAYRATDIAMGGGERRNVNASLTVGSTNQTVEVTGTADLLTPVDSGEKASVLTTQQLENFIQVGSNAAEYLKIMPGFGNQNGSNNKSSYSGQVVGINGNGDGGDLAASPSTGVGLANIRDRLSQAYGAAHRFETRKNERGGFSVIIEIPYETGDKA